MKKVVCYFYYSILLSDTTVLKYIFVAYIFCCADTPASGYKIV